MTALERRIYRVTRGAYPVLYRRQLRQIVVGLETGDVLTFREKGRRHRWSLPIDGAFRYAVRIKADADRREKQARRKEARRR
ncbi:MAG TPA: hypothetical protein VFB04_07710 [Terriglobales bacterium]|nr:hypothetical protein [Terriglobales bacterium]